MSSDASENVVLAHAPGRTAAFVLVVGLMAASIGLSAVNALARRSSPFDLIGVAVAAILLYVGVMTAVHAIARRPLLQTSAAGIAIANPWGRLFVPWSDVADIGPGRFRWLRITLRADARPAGSAWARLMSTSVWVRNTVAVPMFTTVPGPEQAADVLRRMQSRHLAW
ncbi:MAG TPA: PH domain-containing protein [Xanthobacteraceae bacterium]|nr:PH domain-containing protein [Xanthobacteraceae bacterium]